ncbi:MAG: DNA topoisomerase IV subunit A [Metamycoplasmataceae bacterium]
MSKKEKENLDNENDKNIEFKSLDYIMSDRFSRYAKYIILQRALPDIRDGLKPVQRRILYSMYDLNLTHDKAFKKSARVVGDVIGKYHPHGDSSIYEALVRMAQDWKINLPLVEMHGNKGSIDDDPAAAMRYTETRLAKISTEILDELDKKIVPFAPNFDDTEKEPVYLPSYLPNLLVNGARGIAAGYATEIPPHNLGEIIEGAIAKIKKPELSISSLQKYIKGPDFPTGGVIYSKKGIDESFEKGNGRIVILSKYKIIDTEKEKKIIIFEIPYGVVKAKLVRQIDELRINSILNGINDVRDESDRQGISIVIELDLKANAEAIISFLLKKTDLQIFYSYNMVLIHENAPKLLGISKMLDYYISFIKELKTKSIKYDLNISKNRLEIIEGFIKVSKIIDQVIKVIRETDDSKAGVILNLRTKLDFSELQAKAIAEMRLYRLNRTDVSLFLNEKKILEEKITFWNSLLKDEELFNKNLIEHLKKIKKEFGVERRSRIVEEEFNLNFKVEEVIENEVMYLSISKDGYIKRVSKKSYESNEISNFSLKENDKLVYFGKAETKSKLIIFSNKGNYIYIPLHKLDEVKWKDFGIHISDFATFEKNEEIIDAIQIADFNVNAYLVSITKNGMGKKSSISQLETSRYSKPLTYMKLKSLSDEVIGIKLVNTMDDILLITSDHKAIKHSNHFLPSISLRSIGNTMIKLRGNYITSFAIANNDEDIFIMNTKFKINEISFKNLLVSNKPNLGVQLVDQQLNKHSFILANKVEEKEYLYMDKDGLLIKEKYPLSKNNSELKNSFPLIKNNSKWILFLNENKVESNNYFLKENDNEQEKEQIEESLKKVNKIFEDIEDKAKEFDKDKIDDILKKFKI